MQSQMLLRTQSSETKSFNNFIDRYHKARQISKTKLIKEIHPVVATPNSPNFNPNFRIKLEDNECSSKPSPIVFMSNSSSCVMLHPKTNNPIESKISAIATNIKRQADIRQ